MKYSNTKAYALSVIADCIQYLEDSNDEGLQDHDEEIMSDGHDEKDCWVCGMRKLLDDNEKRTV